MRLIDADALIAQIETNICKPCRERKDDYHGVRCRACQYNDEINDIDSAPTVEQRKTGEWVVTSEFEDCRYAKCNQCKVTQVFYYNKPLTNFCPNCGADMREGQDG